MKYRRLSIIIPILNEEHTIQEIIERVKAVSLPGLEKEIIVVDDGSEDRTPHLLRGIEGIHVMTHDRNRGKGAAIKTGIQGSTGDLLLLQDGDLEYDPEDYGVLLRPILKGEVEFVMGCRFFFDPPKFFTKGGQPFFSHYLGNLLVRELTNLLYGQTMKDYEACYKVFTKNLIRSFSVESDGFAFDNELICKSLRRGYRIVEVPVQYKSRLYGEGKKITWRDGVVMLWTILKWRFLAF